MKRILSIASLAFFVFFIAGFWVGCIIDYNENAEEVYYCEKDEDCSQPAFECNSKNVCVRHQGGGGPAECIDVDGDGYGAAGTDRSACKFKEPDCDDNDGTVYPGAPEICDGKKNDCNATDIDVAPCNRASDCPQHQTDGEGHPIKFTCESKVCVARPTIELCLGAGVTPCPECQNSLACVDGALDIVPVACR